MDQPRGPPWGGEAENKISLQPPSTQLQHSQQQVSMGSPAALKAKLCLAPAAVTPLNKVEYESTIQAAQSAQHPNGASSLAVAALGGGSSSAARPAAQATAQQAAGRAAERVADDLLAPLTPRQGSEATGPACGRAGEAGRCSHALAPGPHARRQVAVGPWAPPVWMLCCFALSLLPKQRGGWVEIYAAVHHVFGGCAGLPTPSQVGRAGAAEAWAPPRPAPPHPTCWPCS